MHRRHHLLAALVALVIAVPAIASAASDKDAQRAERYWNPLGQYQVLADVAEVEPNGSLATAQTFNCGDVLRPATISAAGDTDYVKITVGPNTTMTIGTDADGTTGQLVDSRIRLFNASGAVLASDDDSGPGAYSLLTYTSVTGGTYYVGIAGYSSSYYGIYKFFVTCTTPQPPPANDICAGAQVLECGNINISGSTANATNDYSPSTTTTGGCTGYYAQGKDVVYVINAAGSDSLDITYTSSAADGSIYIITNCGSPTTSCVRGVDATFSGAAEHITYTFPTSGVYYLVADNYGTNTGGAFTMTGSITCHVVPANRKTWGQLKAYYR